MRVELQNSSKRSNNY